MNILQKLKPNPGKRAERALRNELYYQAQTYAKLIPTILARQGGATLTTSQKRKVVMNKFKIEQILIHDDYFMFKIDMIHTPWGKGVEILKDDAVLQTMALAMNRQIRAYYNAGEGFYYMIPRKDGLSDIPEKISWDDVQELLPAVDKPGPETRRYWTLPIGVGENKRIYKIDLRDTPHILILGTTGSGKTVFVKNLILSLVAKNGPRRLRMAICDFKRGPDYRAFARLPHIGMPTAVRVTKDSDINEAGELVEKNTPDIMDRVLTTIDEITAVLLWGAAEIDRRNKLFDEKVIDINMYNKVHQREYMPHILLVVDELAIIIDELSRARAQELHRAIGRIARLGRSAGVHLVLGIQNLETKYLSGGISNNISTRIVGKFASGAQSGNAIGTGSWAAVQLPDIPGRVIFRDDAALHEIQTPWVDPKFAVKMIEEISDHWGIHGDGIGEQAMTVFRHILKNNNGRYNLQQVTRDLSGVVPARAIRRIATEFESTDETPIDIEIDGSVYRLVPAQPSKKLPRRLVRVIPKKEATSDGTGKTDVHGREQRSGGDVQEEKTDTETEIQTWKAPESE